MDIRTKKNSKAKKMEAKAKAETQAVKEESVEAKTYTEEDYQKWQEEKVGLVKAKKEGEASILIVSEILALVPLRHLIKAAESGKTLVAYFKERLELSDQMANIIININNIANVASIASAINPEKASKKWE